VKKLSTHPGFGGFLIVNADGIPIRTSLDHAEAVQYAGAFAAGRTREVGTLFLRACRIAPIGGNGRKWPRTQLLCGY
jgi:hypothetical protein